MASRKGSWTPERRKAQSELFKSLRAAGKLNRHPVEPMVVPLAPPPQEASPVAPAPKESFKPDPPQSIADIQHGPALDRSNPPRDMFSGQVKGTEVFSKSGDPLDPIPGYRTYWIVDRDQGSRLTQARMSGWEYVGTDEVVLNEGQSSDDTGGHIRRWSRETGPSGQPIYMYLMKKPLWLQKIHDAAREAIHDALEAKIRGGAKSDKPGDKQYSPGEIAGSKLPAVEIQPKLYIPR
jgi:hypothetical protein